MDNRIDENYLTRVYVQSSLGGLSLYNQNSIYKRKNILNTDFDHIEVTFLKENNEVIQFKDFLVLRYLLSKYI